MLSTVFFLIVCAIIGLVCLPLAMGVVPVNKYYGLRTERMAADPALWARVNGLGAQLLIAAAGIFAILLMMYNGTWLRGFGAQVILFVFLFGAAAGAIFWFERHNGAWK